MALWLDIQWFRKRELQHLYVLTFSEIHFSVLLQICLQNITSFRNLVTMVVTERHFCNELNSCLEGLIPSRGIIVMACSGTTMTERHVNIRILLEILNQNGFGPEKRFVHLDAALSAIPPRFQNCNHDIVPSFKHEIDSMSFCGHKFLGSPDPCSVFLIRKEKVNVSGRRHEYVRTTGDFSVSTTRPVKGMLYLYACFQFEKHFRVISILVEQSLPLADYCFEQLLDIGVDAQCYPHAITIYFKKPSDDIVNKYCLVTENNISHVIILNHVRKQIIDDFINDYKGVGISILNRLLLIKAF